MREGRARGPESSCGSQLAPEGGRSWPGALDPHAVGGEGDPASVAAGGLVFPGSVSMAWAVTGGTPAAPGRCLQCTPCPPGWSHSSIACPTPRPQTHALASEV